MSGKAVKVSCTGSDVIDFRRLHGIQGAFKERSTHDIERMAESIERYGFSFPFFVWWSKKQAWCLDGHGRIEALHLLESRGVEIPDLPYVTVQASSLQEAKQKLLRLNSQYGVITREGILEFIADIEVDWDSVVLPGGPLDIESMLSPEDNLSHYSRKVEAPVYLPTGERPAVNELYDEARTTALLDRIETANVSEEDRQFLREAARRHTVFNYAKIAEYYAHAGAELQGLMEDSALVIIDFKKALELGFIKFTAEIDRLYEKDMANAKK